MWACRSANKKVKKGNSLITPSPVLIDTTRVASQNAHSSRPPQICWAAYDDPLSHDSGGLLPVPGNIQMALDQFPATTVNKAASKAPANLRRSLAGNACSHQRQAPA